jgi:hypothetical protein
MIRPRLLALALLAAPCLAQSAAPAVKQTVTAAMGTTAPTVKVAEKPIVPFTVWQLRPGDSTESQVTPVQLNPSGYWLMLYIDSSSKAPRSRRSLRRRPSSPPALSSSPNRPRTERRPTRSTRSTPPSWSSSSRMPAAPN